jgi:CDP-glucose 4,6-dehydratase
VENRVSIDPGFWSGRRVLVTGHTGFKGSWLSLWLHHLGADVTGYSLAPPTSPSLFADARVEDRVTSRAGDVTDADAVEAAVHEARPEVVFHLAAQALVRSSYDEPLSTLRVNVLGTATVLDALRRAPSVRSTVVVTSDKCYENEERPEPYRESDRLGGRDPYSVSKGCAELVTAAWRRSFLPGVGVATARAGNVVGGGDWAEDRLVPDCVRALLDGATARVRRPESERPWQHVLDPLAGYLGLARRALEDPARFGEAWNFGPPAEDVRTAAWVADAVTRRWGRPGQWAAGPDDGPPEATVLRLDATRARRELGWAPRLGIEDAVEWTVEWYRAHADGKDAAALTLDQIARYQEREPAS